MHVGKELVPVDDQTQGWASKLLTASWVLLTIFVVVGGLFFWVMGGVKGEDLGALTWTIAFCSMIALMTIRQYLLAERS
ncbi:MULTISPECIES: hypothetical protein [Corynebacterium]|uniref:Uncharacterized protein n=1 Tax=Corynebacterium lipophilum TaxID=2804918 RepID=A0AAW5HY30_9CORY|nr:MULTISPECIES: hypothetical protein [Corynebacterium]MCO6395267.1 hypothetical protein [Corynebacterium lipophilum]MCQ4610541.1 hypothetical protein [Corynebacterium sp. CCUG 61414]MCZ2118091.1 hypothetical protein [Corynebacterium lipophilum]OIR41726.1 hypothetical protein BJP06_09430 [Corynebacterium sp. NML120713]UUA87249.1 hypothetical protein KBP54_10980 [Corynebacterium pseudogenitalium]